MTLLRNGRIKDNVISIHIPCGGMTECLQIPIPGRTISIHIPRGGMTIQEIKLDFRIVFQSTSPVGGMTESGEVPEWLKGISIHIPRGGDDSP